MAGLRPQREDVYNSRESPERMGKYFKKHWSTILLMVILIAGFCLLLYPTVSDWWNSFHQSRAIASYVEQVENMADDEAEKMLDLAREYNEKLANREMNFFLSEEEEKEYASILDVSGTGVMGYVQIPSIDVNLPIYHGTDETILQVAVGHLEGTSFPIGGEGTHAALSGHRGLPSARLFTDLDRVVEGDIFTVTILGQTVTYMVDQIRIVLPEEVSDLAIEPGKDYCTLITCTPYGINSHRMLVRGARIENLKEALIITTEAVRIPSYLVIPAVGVPLLFLLLFFMLIYYSIRRPKKSRQQLMEEYRQGLWHKDDDPKQ